MGRRLQSPTLETGDSIGYYTVLELISEISKPRRYKLKCICGNIREVNHHDLIRTYKSTKSCGCMTGSIIQAKKTLPQNIAVKNMIFNRYKYKADKRKYVFDLRKEDFIQLITSDCYYCGSTPINSYSYDNTFYYNGIDRIDNTQGYTINNVVPCCKWCNQAKSTMSYAEFIDYIKRIYNRIKDK